MRRNLRHPPRDRAIAALAGRQHGVVALPQLKALGITASAVRDRVASGRLHRVHRGVFAVGHPILKTEGRFMAAAFACGPGAVLSHRSAAALWDLRQTDRALIDVTAPTRRSRRGIDVHGSRTLQPADVTTVNGIPCTTVARTLLDLAEVVDRRGLERAYERAEILRMLDTRAVQEVLDRAAGRRGAAMLQSILGDNSLGDAITRSELEERFLAICKSSRLPRPRVNAYIDLYGGGVEVDFLWRRERLIVETDGHASHGTRAAFERDRARDRRLTIAGWRVVRFTWRQVVRERDEVASTLALLLAA
jgi:very-short-patch-repair endonuclease/predicted transcriptional regulator of viral defense system